LPLSEFFGFSFLDALAELDKPERCIHAQVDAMISGRLFNPWPAGAGGGVYIEPVNCAVWLFYGAGTLG